MEIVRALQTDNAASSKGMRAWCKHIAGPLGGFMFESRPGPRFVERPIAASAQAPASVEEGACTLRGIVGS